MAGRHPGAMRTRDERGHPYVNDALAQGYLDKGNGPDAEYPIDEVAGRRPNHGQANEIRLAIGRAGRHLNVSTPAWVVDQDGQPCYRECADPSAPHGVRFRIHSKNQAREHVVRQSGGNPANLKYNPFARAEGPAVDDFGRRIHDS